jgi:hypothetical protein
MTNNGYGDFAALSTSGALAEDDLVTLRGVKIRLRGLTRAQVMQLRKVVDKPIYEPTVLSYGLVTPELDTSQTSEWHRTAPAGEIEEVIDQIFNLSGMGEDAGKAAYKSVRE